ncbi:glycosyltransferase family 4 protein [Paucibacter sp. Y2R2-4]|uniref:glycosyltransferase family 4 protein n=1 Tax=Paucibacter sp. Y2R2-4 TaxID=2893553 RepID=UPI0021E3EBB9|nr:glycosyltransferase family 4 protein [Paucibacter sp. Y2R2-4]MCV2349732.1 glycosyltransferase family 4 protein [Paucibacter sp. Y2R2-4]
MYPFQQHYYLVVVALFSYWHGEQRKINLKFHKKSLNPIKSHKKPKKQVKPLNLKTMKIVHLEDFIHPDAGYQVNLLGRLQVLQGHEVQVVTAELDKIPSELTDFFGRDDIIGRDQRFENETGVKIHRVPLFGFYSGRAIFRPFRLLRQVISTKPDVLFVHGEDTLTGIVFILISRWLPFPIVLDCHMLEMASKNKYREYFRWIYKRFITPIILKRKIPLIRVVDSDFVQKCLGIPLSHTDLLSFGTDTDHFKPDPEKKASLRKELGLDPNAFLVVYAGKLDEHKGGKFLSSAISRSLNDPSNRPIEFLVIGNAVGEYGETVESELAGSQNKIVRLPTQRYFDLARFYQMADLSVFPKQCSMSFFEAQSCGLPILFEENEINSQRAEYKSAVTFEPESIEDFRAKLIELSKLPPDEYAEYGKNARKHVLEKYDFVPIAKQFTEVLARTIKQWKTHS